MEIKIFSTEKSFLKSGTDLIKRIKPKSVALSGGETPKKLYSEMAKLSSSKKIIFYQVDERCVKKTHNQSNYKTIFNALIKKTSAEFHHFNTNLKIAESLKKYEKELPRQPFDLTILGIGKDGHTASLFPYSKALASKSRTAHTTTNKFKIKNRLTLTFKKILESKTILILIKGKNKIHILKNFANKSISTNKFPAIKLLSHKNLHIYFLL